MHVNQRILRRSTRPLYCTLLALVLGGITFPSVAQLDPLPASNLKHVPAPTLDDSPNPAAKPTKPANVTPSTQPKPSVIKDPAQPKAKESTPIKTAQPEPKKENPLAKPKAAETKPVKNPAPIKTAQPTKPEAVPTKPKAAQTKSPVNKVATPSPKKTATASTAKPGSNINWAARREANALMDQANAKYLKQDYKGALAIYSVATNKDPQYAVPFANRGNAQVGLGNFQSAIADYTKAVSLDATGHPLWCSKTILRSSSGF
jgi:outer membrane biosynthesis protein TonB